MGRTQRGAETARPGLAVVAVSETKGSKMRHQSGRASNGAIARFVVWNRRRPQRLADQNGRDELLTARQDRERSASEARKVLGFGLTLFSLRHKHCKAFAGPAGLDEFAHGQFMAAIAAILKRRDEPRSAFG